LHPSSDVKAPGDRRQEGAEHVRGVDAVESERREGRDENEKIESRDDEKQEIT